MTLQIPKCPDCGNKTGYHALKDRIYCSKCWKWFEYEIKITRFISDFTPREAAEFGASGLWKPDERQ